MDEDIFVPINNDLERKIADVFDIFDHAGTKNVDLREVGTIVRALGCCPSEDEVQEMVLDMEDNAHTGSVHLITFLPYVSQLITEHKYQPASPEQLLEAFEKLDVDGRGFLTKEFIYTAMTQDGEPFNQDEIDEMLEIAIDPHTQTVPYEYYINQLIYEPAEEDNMYVLADKIEDAKPKAPVAKRFSQMMAAMQQGI